MFDTKKIDEIIAHEDISRDVLPDEVAGIITAARDEGLFSDAVFVLRPDSYNLVLGLKMSDEVQVVSQDIGVREFLAQDPELSTREAVRFVLSHAESILNEIRDAVLGGRQADWRHTKVLGR